MIAEAKAFATNGKLTLQMAAKLQSIIDIGTQAMDSISKGTADWKHDGTLASVNQLVQEASRGTVLTTYLEAFLGRAMDKLVRQTFEHAIVGFQLLVKPLYTKEAEWSGWAKDKDVVFWAGKAQGQFDDIDQAAAVLTENW